MVAPMVILWMVYLYVFMALWHSVSHMNSDLGRSTPQEHHCPGRHLSHGIAFQLRRCVEIGLSQACVHLVCFLRVSWRQHGYVDLELLHIGE